MVAPPLRLAVIVGTGVALLFAGWVASSNSRGLAADGVRVPATVTRVETDGGPGTMTTTVGYRYEVDDRTHVYTTSYSAGL